MDLDAALVEAVHTLCLDVHPFTINEKKEMKALIRIGVDGMFTTRRQGGTVSGSADRSAAGTSATSRMRGPVVPVLTPYRRQDAHVDAGALAGGAPDPERPVHPCGALAHGLQAQMARE